MLSSGKRCTDVTYGILPGRAVAIAQGQAQSGALNQVVRGLPVSYRKSIALDQPAIGGEAKV